MRVVDLTADFRLRSLATYERWYGAHPAPGAARAGRLRPDRAAPRARSPAPGIVANPGCYPTASLLALAPLARAGLIADVVIDAKQGISGRRARVRRDHAPVDGRREHRPLQGRRAPPHARDRGAARRCSIPPHPELPVQFQAHLVPLDQGELASCYVTPTRPRRAPRSCASCTRPPTRDEPFVEVVDAPPGVREVRETNFCRCSPPPTSTPARCSCSRRSTTSGRGPPRRRCRTST